MKIISTKNIERAQRTIKSFDWLGRKFLQDTVFVEMEHFFKYKITKYVDEKDYFFSRKKV